jgi:hypothetical protein
MDPAGSGLLQFERVALVMFVLLLLGAFLYDPVYRALWILGAALIVGMWVLAGIFAIFGLVFAFSDVAPALPRLRTAVAVPIALAAALLLSRPVFDAGRWTFGYLHLRWNEDAYRDQLRRDGSPMAFRYVEGIPDGGVAIVHSRGPLAPDQSWALIGEPIRRCDRLRGDFHLCSFD